MTPALDVSGIAKSFGGIRAIDNISFSIDRGEVLGVIGPNGAGKSTLINCLQGVIHPDRGTIRLNGRDATSLGPHRTFQLGLARSFQSPQYFVEMTALEYLLLGSSEQGGWLSTILGGRVAKSREAETAKRAMELLDKFGCTDAARQRMGGMSYGTKKIVDLVRALMSHPKVVLLDEPTSGTGMSERVEITAATREIAGLGVSVLVVDHDVRFIRSVAPKVLVLDAGEPLALGDTETVLRQPDVHTLIGFSMTTEEENSRYVHLP